MKIHGNIFLHSHKTEFCTFSFTSVIAVSLQVSRKVEDQTQIPLLFLPSFKVREGLEHVPSCIPFLQMLSASKL